jgi:hypothetical protein
MFVLLRTLFILGIFKSVNKYRNLYLFCHDVRWPLLKFVNPHSLLSSHKKAGENFTG